MDSVVVRKVPAPTTVPVSVSRNAQDHSPRTSTATSAAPGTGVAARVLGNDGGTSGAGDVPAAAGTFAERTQTAAASAPRMTPTRTTTSAELRIETPSPGPWTDAAE